MSGIGSGGSCRHQCNPTPNTSCSPTLPSRPQGDFAISAGRQSDLRDVAKSLRDLGCGDETARLQRARFGVQPSREAVGPRGEFGLPVAGLRCRLRGMAPARDRPRSTPEDAHDTRLVAAMLVYGIKHILTFNVSDFARYPNIIVH
jgi:hypothetical protein